MVAEVSSVRGQAGAGSGSFSPGPGALGEVWRWRQELAERHAALLAQLARLAEQARALEQQVFELSGGDYAALEPRLEELARQQRAELAQVRREVSANRRTGGKVAPRLAAAQAELAAARQELAAQEARLAQLAATDQVSARLAAELAAREAALEQVGLEYAGFQAVALPLLGALGEHPYGRYYRQVVGQRRRPGRIFPWLPWGSAWAHWQDRRLNRKFHLEALEARRRETLARLDELAGRLSALGEQADSTRERLSARQQELAGRVGASAARERALAAQAACHEVLAGELDLERAHRELRRRELELHLNYYRAQQALWYQSATSTPAEPELAGRLRALAQHQQQLRERWQEVADLERDLAALDEVALALARTGPTVPPPPRWRDCCAAGHFDAQVLLAALGHLPPLPPPPPLF